jgi:hypothetical protein
MTRSQDELLERCRSMPPGTFGAAYAAFMGDRHFHADDRPPVRCVMWQCCQNKKQSTGSLAQLQADAQTRWRAPCAQSRTAAAAALGVVGGSAQRLHSSARVGKATKIPTYPPHASNAASRRSFVDDAELAYVITRAREVHDFWHVLFDCHTNVFGELALKGLEFVQVRRHSE